MNKKKLLLAGVTILTLLVIVVPGCTNPTSDDSSTSTNQSPGIETADQQLISDEIDDKAPANQQSEANDKEQQLRTDNQGGVIVDVLWENQELDAATKIEEAEYSFEEYQIFNLSLTTHSGDLRDYPYLENSVLIVDDMEISPVKFEVLSNDSHHPSVLLLFPAKDDQGKDYITANAATIQLLLKELRDVPVRQFVWEPAAR